MIELAIERMKQSLLGLSVGDALGRQAFLKTSVLEQDTIPKERLAYTDDTRMAIALCRVLLEYGEVNADALAKHFADDFIEDPERGYGSVAYHILHQIASGVSWEEASTSVYNGGWPRLAAQKPSMIVGSRRPRPTTCRNISA